MFFLWGIDGIDRSQADVNNPFDKYMGDPIYDAAFDFNDPNAQRSIDRTLDQLAANARLIESGACGCVCCHMRISPAKFRSRQELLSDAESVVVDAKHGLSCVTWPQCVARHGGVHQGESDV